MVTIPLKVESTANKREHWGARAARAARERKAALLLVKPELRKLGRPRLAVHLTRIAPRELDDDNLRSSLKAVRDGVAAALRVDDSSPLIEWVYWQRKGEEPGEHAVEVDLLWSEAGRT
jgi:hypothetical protein